MAPDPRRKRKPLLAPRDFEPSESTSTGIDIAYRAAIPAAVAGDIKAIGTVVGQISSGPTIDSLMQKGDAEKSGYQWVHGPSANPFQPHEDLDGVEFESFDDSALVNTTGFPDNEFYLPGDHTGCTCDFMPLWMSIGGT